MDMTSSECEKYLEARKLSESTNDPETEPYKSLYEARTTFQNLRDDIHKRLEDNLSNELLTKEAAIEYQLGMNYINTEEISAGQEKLVRVLELCKDDVRITPNAVSVVIAAQNELGLLWSGREDGIQKAHEYLNEAEKVYHDYHKKYDQAPLTIDDHFLVESTNEFGRKNFFENLHTLTLFYLAQVYKSLDKSDLSASYCMQTLQRQLEFQTYKPLEWALHCACLSQYFIQHSLYMEAKHCLASASVVRDQIIDGNVEEGKMKQIEADVARCWVKYFLSLLDTSKERIISGEAEQAIADNLCSNDKKLKSFKRFSLEVTSIEEKTPHEFCVTFQQAKAVFLLGKQFATQALDYFVIDGFVTDHVELHQDISRLYHYVAYFERSVELRCRMFKRRIDLLIPILNELNPQFYLAVCRQLQFELAEIYGDMMDMKRSLSSSDNQPQNWKKINMLCQSSIRYFKEFLNTVRLPDHSFPQKFEDDVERPALIAHFHIARLYSKIVTHNATDRVENLQLSVKNYKFVTDYVDMNEEAKSCIKDELEICKELVALLPKTMDRLITSISAN